MYCVVPLDPLIEPKSMCFTALEYMVCRACHSSSVWFLAPVATLKVALMYMGSSITFVSIVPVNRRYKELDRLAILPYFLCDAVF